MIVLGGVQWNPLGLETAGVVFTPIPFFNNWVAASQEDASVEAVMAGVYMAFCGGGGGDAAAGPRGRPAATHSTVPACAL